MVANKLFIKGGDYVSKDCQCSSCGDFVEYLVDNGICEDCFKKQD